jgi:lipid A 4'-phosphatase
MTLIKETKIGLLLCLGLFIVSAIVFLVAPQIDLSVAHLFANGSEGFPLARHPIAKWFNGLINNLAVVVALFSIGGLAYTAIRKRALFGLWLRHYGFLFLSLLIGPGLIANALFKENWGRARPRQILEFGGTQGFSPPLLLADQCPSNCSFVSGDASMAFALLALALLAPKWRGVAISSALIFGFWIGLVRIVQGAHFFSDVIFAGIFVCATILILKAFLLDNR